MPSTSEAWSVRYGAPTVGLIKIAAGVTPGHPRLFPRCPSLEHLAAKHPGIVYARIIGAIADGTDTPSLRRALLSLESEKVELESAMAMYHRPTFVEPPPVPDLEKLFRRKVEMLERRRLPYSTVLKLKSFSELYVTLHVTKRVIRPPALTFERNMF